MNMMPQRQPSKEQNSAIDENVVFLGLQNLSGYIQSLQGMGAMSFLDEDQDSKSKILEKARAMAMLIAMGAIATLEKVHHQARANMPRSFRALGELVKHISARSERRQEQKHQVGKAKEEPNKENRKARRTARKSERRNRRALKETDKLGNNGVGQNENGAPDDSKCPSEKKYMAKESRRNKFASRKEQRMARRLIRRI